MTKGQILEHDAEAIVVLAGGIDDKPRHPWSVHAWMQRRWPTGTGSLNHPSAAEHHKPTTLNAHGRVVHESTACAEYLLSAGVNAEHTYKEWASCDTPNALFVHQHFGVAQGQQPAYHLHFHMPRAQTIFNHMSEPHSDVHQCAIVSITQDGMPEDVLRVRKARATKQGKVYCECEGSMQDIAEFIKWLYTKHACHNTLPGIETKRKWPGRTSDR